MFSPNRLLTPKEQALLLGVALAVLVGSGAIYWSARRGASATVAAVSVEKPPPAPAKQPLAPPKPKAGADSAKVSPASPPPAALPTVPAATPAPPTVLPPPAPEPPAEIAVAVRGGVRRPGLFRLPPDSRVADLVMKAGGATTEADLSEINLAARLIDGTTLTVPVGARLTTGQDGRISGHGGQYAAANPVAYLAGTATPEAIGPTPGRSAAANRVEPAESDTAPSALKPKGKSGAGGGLTNLNTATQAELESLPGIGPVLAGRIIEQRPFKSVDELDNVSGIGQKKLEAVRNLVTVE